MLILALPGAFADSFYAEPTNLAPDSATTVNHTFSYAGTLDLAIPSGFSLDSASAECSQDGSNVTCSGGAGWAALEAPSCTEGTRTLAALSINGTEQGSFTYYCISQDKLVSYKAELGHGSFSHVDGAYLPSGDQYMNNIVRVWVPQGVYGAEPSGGTITCDLPTVPVLGGNWGSISTAGNTTTLTKTWLALSTETFRIANIVTRPDLSVGDAYSFNCTSLSYNMTNGDFSMGISAAMDNASFTARNSSAFTLNATDAATHVVYNFTNTELYTAYDVEARFSADGRTITERIASVAPGETILFNVYAEGSGTLTADVSYVPEWHRNSIAYHREEQSSSHAFELAGTGGQLIDVTAKSSLAYSAIADLNNTIKREKGIDIQVLNATADLFDVVITFYDQDGSFYDNEMDTFNVFLESGGYLAYSTAGDRSRCSLSTMNLGRHRLTCPLAERGFTQAEGSYLLTVESDSPNFGADRLGAVRIEEEIEIVEPVIEEKKTGLSMLTGAFSASLADSMTDEVCRPMGRFTFCMSTAGWASSFLAILAAGAVVFWGLWHRAHPAAPRRAGPVPRR